MMLDLAYMGNQPKMIQQTGFFLFSQLDKANIVIA